VPPGNPTSSGDDVRVANVKPNDLRINPYAQRELNPKKVADIASRLNVRAVGIPVVNLRDGVYYVCDGQHRVEGLKAAGRGDTPIKVEVWRDLTEREEAELFVMLNDRLAVKAFELFEKKVNAEFDRETDIDRVVRLQGLHVSQAKTPGSIGATAALGYVYDLVGPALLGMVLRVIRDSFGDRGFEHAVIRGVGLFVQRYHGGIEEKVIVERLAAIRGGVNGLMGEATKIKERTSAQKPKCVAAAIVDIVNRGRGGKKLANWWAE